MVVFFFANPYITYTHQIQIIDTNYSQIKKVFDIYSPYIYIYISKINLQAKACIQNDQTLINNQYLLFFVYNQYLLFIHQLFMHMISR
ncbi:hypothetical protein AtEden1_Chr4g0271551 [Arabidopsis thaliana]